MQIEESITVHAPAPAVWRLVTEPSWYPHGFGALARWEPQGDGLEVGTRVDVRMVVGAAPVGGLVEITEHDENCDLVWKGVSGLIESGHWQLREHELGVTDVTLRVAYAAPGGVAGRIADRAAGSRVRGVVRHALEVVRGDAEQGWVPADPAEAEPPRTHQVLPIGPLYAAHVLARAGLLQLGPLTSLPGAAAALYRDGLTPAGSFAANAARYPDRVAVVDEAGTFTFAHEARRVEAIAAGLADAGLAAGDPVGVMCRNHHGFVEAVAAASRLGADVLLLNTAFAPPQLAGVLEREHAVALVHDAEFAAHAAAVPALMHFTAADLDELAQRPAHALPRTPAPGTRYVLLTSGTTGQPRGAARPVPLSIDPVVALLSRIPLRAGDTTLIASPLFHAWGFGQLSTALGLSSTLVLQRRFDAEAVLAAIERHRVRVLVAVPLMLLRLSDLPETVRRRYDTSSLEVVASSGSALPGGLALRFMDAYGDVLYNVYGSTEAAWATIAGPADLRAEPATAGRPPRGTEVRVVDGRGAPVGPGVTGRVLVGNRMLLDQDTGGRSVRDANGLVATGDLGHFDELGRLFVDGREDDMIVSGGENVYPQEVENVLTTHPAIDEAAVVGVPDPEFGQRLRAVLVLRPDHDLTEDDVRAYVRDRLARFKVPRDVVFAESLPHNETGKTLHRALRAAA